MTKESDIMHEAGRYWVCRTRDTYTVYRTDGFQSIPDSSYPRTADGLSIAIARCEYKARTLHTKALRDAGYSADDAAHYSALLWWMTPTEVQAWIRGRDI